jgi:hemerythrin
MPLLEWNENLAVGVPSVDAQHKKLVALLNELYDAMQAGNGHSVLGKILGELADYTVYHFQYEESLFAQTGYGATLEHKKEHDDLRRLVQEISRKYASGATPALSEELLNFLRQWLFIHITGTDRKFGPHLTSMGIK